MDTPTEQAMRAASPRAMLVDDNTVTLALIAQALQVRGFAVHSLSDGHEALAELADPAQAWPDLLVVDAQMPQLDGFELCRRLRQLPGGHQLPVMMLTGLDDEASVVRAYEAGATDFFIKGPQWSLLAGRLRHLLRSAQTHQDLLASQGQLQRAQALARMGHFEWRRGASPAAMAPAGAPGLNISTPACQLLGLPAQAPMSLRLATRRIPARARSRFMVALRSAWVRAAPWHMDLPVQRQDGPLATVHLRAEPEFDRLGRFVGYTGVVQDVTERRLADERIHQLVAFDALTGLPNRREVLARADQALRAARYSGQSLVALVVGVDRFKLINETLGHAAGDELLVRISRRLRKRWRTLAAAAPQGWADSELSGLDEVKPSVRSPVNTLNALNAAIAPSTHQELEGEGEAAASAEPSQLHPLSLLGRLGSDEFLLLLPIAQGANPQPLAQVLLAAMREPFWVAGQECHVSASVGYAVAPDDGANAAELMRCANAAMLAAKAQAGGQAWRFGPHLAAMDRGRMAVESALYKALERQELELHYQPKVDVATGKITGAEALMRWRRDGRLLLPGDFLQMAEDTGLIVPISEWALGEAARQAKAWGRSFGFDQAVAVNMPATLFQRSNLAEVVQRSLSQAKAALGAVHLEITEHHLMKDLPAVTPALHRLAQAGVQVAVDDFGTGYSSLAYLSRLPIAELKIDRSFVSDLGLRRESAAVVSTIIALARTLGLRVVAEGVETAAQMHALSELGCVQMQGFLFSPALPGGAFGQWAQQYLRVGAHRA